MKAVTSKLSLKVGRSHIGFSAEVVIGIVKFSHCFATTKVTRGNNIKDLKTDIVAGPRACLWSSGYANVALSRYRI